MTENEYQKHESYGMLQITRVSGTERALFGSSIPHGNTIRISIHHGEVGRKLSEDRYYAHPKAIVGVEMSLTQFAEAITSMNTEGVPVTIRYIDGQRMEDCPFVHKREQFVGEFDAKMKRVAHKLDTLKQMAEALAQSPTASKGDRKALLEEVNRVRMEIGDNMPFTFRQFNEQMDKTVLEAKGEFEALVQHTIHSLGVKALKAEDFKLLADNTENND